MPFQSPFGLWGLGQPERRNLVGRNTSGFGFRSQSFPGYPMLRQFMGSPPETLPLCRSCPYAPDLGRVLLGIDRNAGREVGDKARLWWGTKKGAEAPWSYLHLLPQDTVSVGLHEPVQFDPPPPHPPWTTRAFTEAFSGVPAWSPLL